MRCHVVQAIMATLSEGVLASTRSVDSVAARPPVSAVRASRTHGCCGRVKCEECERCRAGTAEVEVARGSMLLDVVTCEGTARSRHAVLAMRTTGI